MPRHWARLGFIGLVCLSFTFMMCSGSQSSEVSDLAGNKLDFTGPYGGLVWHRDGINIAAPHDGQGFAEIPKTDNPHGRPSQRAPPTTTTGAHARGNDGLVKETGGCQGLCQYIVRIDTAGDDNGIRGKLLEAAAGRFLKYMQVSSSSRNAREGKAS